MGATVDLLAGPRGRRVCLEVAARLARAAGTPAADAYLSAAFDAAYALDPGAGSSRVLMRAVLGGPDAPAPMPPAATTPADVASLLEAALADALPPRGRAGPPGRRPPPRRPPRRRRQRPLLAGAGG